MKILDVKIVLGKRLNRCWLSPMQVITTDEGEFIDANPGRNHNHKISRNHKPGYDWSVLIGKELNSFEYKIVLNSGYKWIKYYG